MTENSESHEEFARPREIAEQSEFLELRHVDVARGERMVLHDMNLTVRTGEHVAILGRTGAGSRR